MQYLHFRDSSGIEHLVNITGADVRVTSRTVRHDSGVTLRIVRGTDMPETFEAAGDGAVAGGMPPEIGPTIDIPRSVVEKMRAKVAPATETWPDVIFVRRTELPEVDDSVRYERSGELARMRALVDSTAREWNKVDGIPWEGAIDAAMRAGVFPVPRQDTGRSVVG